MKPFPGSSTRWRSGVVGGLVALALVAILQGRTPGQQLYRDGFENRNTAWAKGAADITFQEAVHDVTDKFAHNGQTSEHILLTAQPGSGSYIHYVYPVGQAPIGDELKVSVWFRANRPNAQVLARLVLPRERKQGSLNEPLTALIRGDAYQLTSRWQRLEIRRPVQLAKDQQQLWRAELRRDIDMTDAYIDQVLINVHGGPGQNEVWIDDLEVGPVRRVKNEYKTVPGSGNPVSREPGGEPATTIKQARTAIVKLNQYLMVNDKRFFLRGVRYSNTPLKTLHDAGFNTLWLDANSSPELIDEALSLGFWLAPVLPVPASASEISADRLAGPMARFLERDGILCWDLGGNHTLEEASLVSRMAQAVRSNDPQRPISATIWDGFSPYSRQRDFMLGVHRWPLMTGLEMPRYYDWLIQRRNLAGPATTYFWTWVQTHAPDWYVALAREGASADGSRSPIGPTPEQIRILTYTALAAGSQGLGFWTDASLGDVSQGKDRLLCLALLNQELKLLQPLLLSVVDPPDWVDTSLPEVKAAVFRTERCLLVIPIWLGKGSQFVPGQSAAAKLTVLVPQVPAGSQAWEISPADVRSLRAERVPGGTKVTIPEFGLTTALIFTGDNGPNGLLDYFQGQARRMRKLAAQWARDLAEAEMDIVLRVETELEKAGHTLPDAQGLKDNARSRLRSAIDRWDNNDYREAYLEAQRALRPLRILMRAQWELAIRELDTPVASPYAVSFFTLPRHWQFLDELRHATPGQNVLPDGNFEASPQQPAASWVPQEMTLDEVELSAWRVGEEPKEGQRCLKLEIKPKNPKLPPGALERTFLAINSPMVKLKPGDLVRISAWVRIPKPITASADGALLYDSAGGEPLAIRLTGDIPKWKKYTLYRRVPASGTINVTLALTGLGTVYFDDVRIEMLTPGAPRENSVARGQK